VQGLPEADTLRARPLQGPTQRGADGRTRHDQHHRRRRRRPLESPREAERSGPRHVRGARGSGPRAGGKLGRAGRRPLRRGPSLLRRARLPELQRDDEECGEARTRRCERRRHVAPARGEGSRQRRTERSIRVDRPTRTGDRGGARCRLWGRPPDCARRGPASGRTGRAALGHGDQVGIDPGHDRSAGASATTRAKTRSQSRARSQRSLPTRSAPRSSSSEPRGTRAPRKACAWRSDSRPP
jgi:hypothetical protein